MRVLKRRGQSSANDINVVKAMVGGFLLTSCTKFLSPQMASGTLAVRLFIESSDVCKRRLAAKLKPQLDRGCLLKQNGIPRDTALSALRTAPVLESPFSYSAEWS